MASRVNLRNVGWRAFIERVTALPGFPPPPNGAATMAATLDQMAENQNELIRRLAVAEAQLARIPFPFQVVGGS